MKYPCVFPWSLPFICTSRRHANFIKAYLVLRKSIKYFTESRHYLSGKKAQSQSQEGCPVLSHLMLSQISRSAVVPEEYFTFSNYEAVSQRGMQQTDKQELSNSRELRNILQP